MSKTKAEIKSELEGIIAELSANLESERNQVDYLQTHVVAKVELDEQLVSSEKSINKLRDLTDSIDGSTPVEAKAEVAALDGEPEIQTEEKFAEGDGIVKTPVEGDSNVITASEKPPSKKK